MESFQFMCAVCDLRPAIKAYKNTLMCQQCMTVLGRLGVQQEDLEVMRPRRRHEIEQVHELLTAAVNQPAPPLDREAYVGILAVISALEWCLGEKGTFQNFLDGIAEGLCALQEDAPQQSRGTMPEPNFNYSSHRH